MNRQKAIKKAYQRSHILTLKNASYRREVEDFFLRETRREGKDVTSNALISNNINAVAVIKSKKPGVVAGIDEVSFYLRKIGIKVIQNKKNGQRVSNGDQIITLEGKIKNILKTERIILNLLQRMSGIATETYSLTKKFKNIAATRKTILGNLDKKAVFIGGGLTHRLSLEDGVLVKDNHKKALKQGVNVKKLQNLKTPFIEIEIEKPSQVLETAKTLIKIKNPAVKILMFDNFTPAQVRDSVKVLKKKGLYSQILLEASGGINSKNVTHYRSVDVISMGSLTHSAKALDMGMGILP